MGSRSKSPHMLWGTRRTSRLSLFLEVLLVYCLSSILTFSAEAIGGTPVQYSTAQHSLPSNSLVLGRAKRTPHGCGFVALHTNSPLNRGACGAPGGHDSVAAMKHQSPQVDKKSSPDSHRSIFLSSKPAAASSLESPPTKVKGASLREVLSSHAGQLHRMKSARDNVSPEVAQMLYEDMLMGRMMEDMCAQMYYRGKVAGFVHLYNGQEAVSTGILKALRPDDYCVSTYRDHVHAISKGVPPREVFAELYGKETGCSKGRGGSMHMFSKPHGMVGGFAYIGEQVPVALGFAYSSAYRRFTNGINDPSADQVTVCFTGDGSTNMGQFYEALNIAAIAKLPIIFVVENNNWAIGMAHYRSTSVPEIYKKAEGFGIPGVEVDGMDVLAVRKVAREAVDRARRGEGPTLIEALTYRFRGHSLADPDELRAPLERRAWSDRDPVVSFGNYMKQMNYATDETLKKTKQKVREIVDDAVKFAEASSEPVVEDIGKYIFGSHYTPAGENLTAEQLQDYAKALHAELEYQDRRKTGDKTPQAPVQLSTEPLTVID